MYALEFTNQYLKKIKLIKLIRTGTHSDLF